MANSVAAIYLGLEYQATLAWIYICDMLSDFTCIEKILFEATDIKTFDDIVACYSLSKPRKSKETNRTICFDYYQIKYHTTFDGAISFSALMDPAFIGAKTDSILQKLTKAVRKLGKDAIKYRFTISMPWIIDPDDLLSVVLSTKDNEIVIDRLFDGTTNKSKKGKLRQELMQHMGISTETELAEVLSVFRIQSRAWTEQDLVDNLNYRLSCLHLQTINGLVNPYSQLIQQWRTRGIIEITPSFVWNACKEEGLIVSVPSSARIPIGIRSFSRGTGNMQDETETMLCLLSDFEGRFPKAGREWNKDIRAKIEDYVTNRLIHDKSYVLYLDTHYTIAFAAGRALDSKSGIDIVPVQKSLSRGREIWTNTTTKGVQYEGWTINVIPNDESDVNGDIVVIFSVTLPIYNETVDYVLQQELPFSKTIHFTLSSGTHYQSIVDGAHARQLAQAVSKKLFEETRIQKNAVLHLFMAMPISLSFFLGQVSRSWGHCVLYEYDFEDTRSYFPTMSF